MEVTRVLLRTVVTVMLLAHVTYTARFSVQQTYVPPNCTYKATYGDFLVQDYVGTLFDLTIFDASKLRRQTFDFHIGIGAAIEGIELGMLGMCKGEKRHIVVPPWLGYGYDNFSNIPGGSTLYFDVVLTNLYPKGFRTELIKAAETCTRKVTQGDRIHEHYKAFLFGSEKPFDESYARNIPAMFTVGDGTMIKAIDYGVVGMCPGEKRRIITPGVLAWGSAGLSNIVPPDAPVIFEIELLWIETGTLITKKLEGPRCFTASSVQAGDIVTVNYTGSSESGATFSSEIFRFSTDESVIWKGLAQGVIGMCVDEVRQLNVPPELAQGSEPGLPKGERVTMEVRLLSRISTRRSTSAPPTTETPTTTPIETTTASTAPPSTASVPVSAPKTPSPSVEDLSKLFDQINTYPDQFIGHQEIDEWLSNVKQVPMFSPEYLKLKHDFFYKKDKDGNGWLTREEFLASKK